MNRLFLISQDSPMRQIIIEDEAVPPVGSVTTTPDGKHVLTLSPVEAAKHIIGQAYAAIQYVNAACNALLHTKFDPHPKPGVDPAWLRNIEGLFYNAHARATLWQNKLSYEMLYLTPVIVLVYRVLFAENTNQILKILEPYEMTAHIPQAAYQLILRELDKMQQKICKNQADYAAVVPKLLQWFGEDDYHGMRYISKQLHMLVDEMQSSEEKDFHDAGIAEAVKVVKAGAVFSPVPQTLPLDISRYRQALQQLIQAVENDASITSTARVIDVVIESIVCNVDAAVSKMTDVGAVWNAFGKQIQNVINSLKETSEPNQSVLVYMAETLTLQGEWESLASYAENLLESRSEMT